MLKLTVKPGEYLLIGNEVKVVFAGGSANNLRILVDAPRSMNIARSSALEKKMADTEPGNFVKHYKDRELSKEAQEKIRAVLMEERRRARAGTRA
ncbi:MAG: carbon storage regulator [Eubacterium sp.]|nr:carbon storage regulator [Eubacterium sp.]